MTNTAAAELASIPRSARSWRRTGADLDWICPHQANLRIVDLAVEKLGVPREKMLVNIDRVGNTSSASIVVM